MAGTVKLLHLLLCICYQAMVSLGMGNINSTNELALLSFKNMLSSGSSSLLASWNTSSHFCKWTGVVCGRRHQDRVVALRMGSFNLSGHISPFLGNLSFLKELDLHDNQLVGRVPMELGHLSRLQVLNLSTNYLGGSIPVSLGGCTKLKKLELSNNQLQGEIPYEIGTLKSLILLSLEKNGLSGEIPRSLTDLQSIQYLSLYSNTLSGEIPPSWGNLTNLQHLDLCTNLLSGTIPSSLGMLSGLYWLDLGHNNLSGLIPTSLWNISSLALFSVRQNMLNGTIPSYIFNNVPRLLKLYMDSNQFYGPIPASISNASDVTELQLNTNFFGGILPREVGNLRALTVLQLNWNFFQAKEPKDWEFLTALTNCSQLQILALAGNKLGGVLPDSFSNLSTSLTIITLNVNRITGGIPKNIGNLVNLQILALNNNSFTGSIPSSLFRLNSLVMFYAYSNNLSGSIPQTIGNLTGLTYLHLDVNDFSGTIPSTFGNLTQLAELGLSGNYLTGLIPSELFNIPTLSTVLDLSENNLEGSLPRNIGNLNNLIRFYAQSNNLSGEIPMSIGKCQLLQYIFLQNNSLNGNIPLPLSQIRSLEIVDLSSNNLSGQIPKSLGELTMLQYINLSFNYFDGEVPDSGVFTNVSAISIQGNGKLCGGIPELQFPTCSLLLRKGKHRNLKVPVITSLVTTLIILPLLCMLLIWHKKIKSKIRSTDCMPGHQLISYSELVRATNGFSTANLLGSGSFGSVYKGENGQSERTTIVAVKVLKLQTPNALKSFVAECETLRNLRHRNLVKIITICSSIDNRGNDFKAIVYDFMLNGSLEGWLHPDTNDHQAEERYLNLTERVTILLDVAYALDYLHCQGPEPVVHCDLKSSNVLLDADMVAHIGDFGLAKILVQGSQLLQQSTSSMGFRGTIGYAAPEYGVGNMVSTHGDIYSYGILVLETITGNRPTDSRLRQGLNLREHVDQALHNRTMDAVDSRLSVDLENVLHNMGDSSYKRKMDCVLSLLRLGMSCTLDSPSSRTPTGCIIKELLAIKESLLREDRT